MSAAITLSGLECASYGTVEETALVAGVAESLDGVDASHIGATECADASRRRRLLSSAVSIAFDISMPVRAPRHASPSVWSHSSSFRSRAPPVLLLLGGARPDKPSCHIRRSCVPVGVVWVAFVGRCPPSPSSSFFPLLSLPRRSHHHAAVVGRKLRPPHHCRTA